MTGHPENHPKARPVSELASEPMTRRPRTVTIPDGLTERSEGMR